ncbi:hypothetical protein MACH09_38990 [Vibrio sp. MACH09]|uniref:hypothetical protein n=1 Tax=Vibrio sp. MACH09 TaxID=3025122 RepID=UPI00278FF502|nr:hypothetical protein [Vibrio sp. MACH09]GLO63391.1 hypothetical protein MACH09_38990 [Vibrio sp. MACH09]
MKSRHYLIGTLVILVLVLPVAVYAYQFGLGIWEDHSKWAEMGSALSGIYSPLIALFAFIILFSQVRQQFVMDTFQHDLEYIRKTVEEVNFYIERLDYYLTVDSQNDQHLINSLRQFNQISESELESNYVRTLVKDFAIKNPKFFNVWGAIYPSLNGLATNGTYPYEHNYTATLLKVSTVLSFEVCVALDKMYFVLGQYKKEELRYWQE